MNMKRNVNKVALLALICMTSMGFACSADQKTNTMQAINDFAIALDAVVDTEISLHNAGKIPEETHRDLLLKLRDVAVSARTAERTFLAGGDATGTLQTIRASLDSLANNEFPSIVDETARGQLLLALGSAKNLLTVLMGEI